MLKLGTKKMMMGASEDGFIGLKGENYWLGRRSVVGCRSMCSDLFIFVVKLDSLMKLEGSLY